MKTLSKFLITLCLICHWSVNAKWFSHSFDVMGTKAKVEFEWSDEKQAQVLIQAVVDEMHRIDRLMSPYKEQSELSNINRMAHQAPLKISKETFDLLVKAEYFSVLTQGAFDISFSSLAYLYDYREKTKPSEKQIKQLKQAINYQKIILDKTQQTVFFEDSRIKIDLGGIGKGHAVDQCILLLQKAGVRNAYVNAGGDSRLLGRKNNRLWYIGIKHPRDPDKLLVNLPLEEVSLSTSGDYERYFEKDGVRYHHIIDPKTGDSARNIRSATILANDSTTADALSTSIFILGVAKGMELINTMPEVSAIMVDAQGKLFVSQDLAPAE